MSILDKVSTITIVFVFMIALNLRGQVYVSAQTNQTCAKETYACTNNFQLSQDKEILCRSSQDYLNCLNAAAKHCEANAEFFQDGIEKSRQQLRLHCSSSSTSTPAVSFICLILATLQCAVVMFNNYLD